MNQSIRSSALATSLLAGIAILAAPPAWAQQAPNPADAPVLEPGHSTVATVAETPDSGTMKRADKDMVAVLKKLSDLGAKPIESRSVAEARAQPTPADAVKAVLKDRGKDPVALMAAMKVSKKDMTYPTAGGTQAIRLYTPEGAAGAGPLPIIVYYHGGGWVIADIDTYEASAMALAKKSGAIVASVEYRRAPESKFPAAHQDAFAAYQWVLANAGQFGGDATRVAVAGESAGGNLATNVAIMARDQKVQAPLHMLIVYPVAGTNMTTPSYIANQNAMPLSKGAMGWFVDKVLATPDDAKSPMLNLTTAMDLKGLPPATLITDSIDPLMSEGAMLAEKLKAAGVATTYKNYEGVTHEFFGMGAVVPEAEAAEDLAAHDLKAAFVLGKPGK